jgi:nucleotide-binding universal stress UspA family protein
MCTAANGGKLERMTSTAHDTHILVGVDASPRAVDALALAGAFARTLDAPVTIANVRPPVPQPWLPGNEDLKARLRSESERVLGEARATLGDRAGVSTRSVVDSSAPKALHRLADELGASLVVVAQTHRGRVARLGGVAERLIHASSCAVAVAPPGLAEHPPAPGFGDIAVAFDASPESVAALGQAVALAERGGGSLRVDGIVDVSATAWNALPMDGYYEEMRDALATGLRGDIEQALSDAGRPGAAEVHLFDGAVAETLLKAAEGAGLLVCGSRGWGPVGAALLGSVSNRLAHSAPCPLLAVPDGARPLVAGSPAAMAADER